MKRLEDVKKKGFKRSLDAGINDPEQHVRVSARRAVAQMTGSEVFLRDGEDD